MRLADPDNPAAGLVFDGRVAEDFKLSSGTWVNVGMLRVRAIAALAPIAQDIVVTGHDRNEVGLLIFPNVAACRTLCPGIPADAPPAAVLADPAVRKRVATGLQALKRENSASSMHATGALLLIEAPSIDAGEITDKGYINQRAVLTHRQEHVERLHGGADAAVIRLAE